MKVCELEQPVSEISKISLSKKGFYTAKELDSKWSRIKKTAVVTASKLFPEYVIATVWGPYIHVFLFSKDNLVNPLAYLELSEVQGGKLGSKPGLEVNIASVRNTSIGGGVGYKMYVILIRELGVVLVSDKSQSEGGSKVWSKLFKERGISVYGWDPKAPTDKQFFQVHDFDGDGFLDGYDRRLYHDEDEPVLYEPKAKTQVDRKDVRNAMQTRLVAVKSIR